MNRIIFLLLLFTCGCKGDSGLEPSLEIATKSYAPRAIQKENADTKDDASGGQDGRDVTPVRMIIQTGDLAMEVQSHDVTLQAVQTITRSMGGYVTNTSTELAYHNVKKTHATVRVPSVTFDSAMVRFRNLAITVERESIQGQDVTEEFVDTEARLANKRAEEKQLLIILQRTGSVRDLLEVQRELFRVREEIERFEGRRKYLQSQVDLATISIEFHEPYPAAISQHGGFWSTLGQGFENGFYGFANVLSGTITFLIAGLPVFVILYLVVWGLIRIIRRRKSA